MGETLAYATLLDQGYGVRLSGEDVSRGTFTHRHAVVHDQNREKWDDGTYVPLEHIEEGQPSFEVIEVLSRAEEQGRLDDAAYREVREKLHVPLVQPVAGI